MIDFKKNNLFDRERRKFEDFKNKKLFTPEEFASRVDTSDDTLNNINIVDTESYLGGSPIDLFGGEGEDMWSSFGDDANGEGSRKRHVDISNERAHETGIWWKDILYAPFFLVLYVFKSMVYDFPDKNEWLSIFKAVQKVSLVTAGISLFLWVCNFNFIFSLMFQTIAATLMFGLSISMQKFLEGKGASEDSADDAGAGDMGMGGDISMDMFGGSADGDMLGGAGDIFGGLGTDDQALDLDGSNLSMQPSGGGGFDFNALFNPVNSNDIVENVDVGKYKVLKESPINIESTEEFERTLMQVYMENEKYRGVEIPERKALIESLYGYIVTNDKAFGSWNVAQPHSTEFNHVAYALFKGLGQIANVFLTDEEALIVRSIKSNPLLYKIEVELPNYFKSSQIKSKVKEIEDALRDGEADNAVQVMVSYYQGIFVFKFLRLDNPNLISLGDILRFYDEDKGETALEAYANPKMGLPILIGLKNNEYPYVVDLEANTSGVIIGGSGSGKSWFTFLMLFNFVLTNDYQNVNFVVFDKKNAAFWNQFAKFPHVLGYQTDCERYLECMRELYAEVDRRKALLVKLNEENIKGYRERLRKDKQYEKLKEVPNLIIIVDEITSTMQELETYYLDRDEVQYYKEYRSILAKISQEGRSLGVRLLCIGQRSIDNSVPKNVIANSSFKFAMKMDAESDFGIMMGKEVESLPKPSDMGLGLVKTMSEGGIHPIKTLTVGGANEYQILRLIRILAFEWIRRADGKDDILNMPETMNLPKCYNRSKFVQESMEEIADWRILSPSEVTPYKPNGTANSMPIADEPMYNPSKPIEEFNLPETDFEDLEAEFETSFNNTDNATMMEELPAFEELPAEDDLFTPLEQTEDNQTNTDNTLTDFNVHPNEHLTGESTGAFEWELNNTVLDAVGDDSNDVHEQDNATQEFDFSNLNFQASDIEVELPYGGELFEMPPMFGDAVLLNEFPAIEVEDDTPIFNNSLKEEFIGFDMFAQDISKPSTQPAVPSFFTELNVSETAPLNTGAEIPDINVPAEDAVVADVSLQQPNNVPYLEKTQQETSVNSTALKVSRVKIYGYILRYGERLNTDDGVTKARIHKDALLASFSGLEVDDAQNHTHVIREGDSYIAWKK